MSGFDHDAPKMRSGFRDGVAIDQLGFVVPDLEVEIKRWLRLGVGPWLTLHGSMLSEHEYRGISSSPRVDVALSQVGDLQLELISPLDDEPSIYRDFLASGRQGLQHVGWFVGPYRGAVHAAAAAQHTIVQRGSWSGVRFASYELTNPLTEVFQRLRPLGNANSKVRGAVRRALLSFEGQTAELIELNATSREVFEKVKDHAAAWTPRADPIVPLLTPLQAIGFELQTLAHRVVRWVREDLHPRPRDSVPPAVGFHTVDKAENLPNNYVHPYYIDGIKRRVAVARVGTSLYAFDDLYANASLSAGLLRGTTIMSQCDGSQFDVTTGAVVRGPASDPLAVYAVREQDGVIQVRL